MTAKIGFQRFPARGKVTGRVNRLIRQKTPPNLGFGAGSTASRGSVVACVWDALTVIAVLQSVSKLSIWPDSSMLMICVSILPWRLRAAAVRAVLRIAEALRF
jgi:hypothetical protein